MVKAVNQTLGLGYRVDRIPTSDSREKSYTYATINPEHDGQRLKKSLRIRSHPLSF